MVRDVSYQERVSLNTTYRCIRGTIYRFWKSQNFDNDMSFIKQHHKARYINNYTLLEKIKDWLRR